MIYYIVYIYIYILYIYIDHATQACISSVFFRQRMVVAYLRTRRFPGVQEAQESAGASAVAVFPQLRRARIRMWCVVGGLWMCIGFQGLLFFFFCKNTSYKRCVQDVC